MAAGLGVMGSGWAVVGIAAAAAGGTTLMMGLKGMPSSEEKLPKIKNTGLSIMRNFF